MLLEMGLLSCLGYSGIEIIKTLRKKDEVNIDETIKKENLYDEYPILYSQDDEDGVQIATNYYVQNNEFYKDAMYLNSMVIGSPGSWKSTVGIYPNLLNKKLRGTLIVNDPKGDSYNKTSKIQKKFGRKVKRISFREIEDKINVLRELKTEDDIFEFSKTIMINSASVGFGISQETMTWVNMSATLLTSLFCFVKNYKSKKNNQEVDNIAQALLLLQMVEDESELEEILKNDGMAYKYFLSYKTGGSKSNAKNNIVLNITTMLAIFLSESVRNVTDETTIDLNNLRKEEHIIYLCGDEIGSNKMAPIIAPIVQLLLKKCIELGPKPSLSEKEKSKILDVHFFLDEFGNMGRIENLNQYLTMMREYRINMYMVLQTFSQLYISYTPSEVGSIMAGTGHILFLTNNRETSTASKIVEMASSIKREHIENHYSENGKLIKTTKKYIDDDVISLNEAGSIKRGEGILFVGSQNIMKIKFNRWFEESRYEKYKAVKLIEESEPVLNKVQVGAPESLILKEYRENKKTKMPIKYNISNIKPCEKEVAITTEVKEINIDSYNRQKIVMEYQKFIKENFK